MKRFAKTLLLSGFSCLLYADSHSQSSWKMQPIAIQTRWAKQVNPARVLPEYPRPQMVREQWVNLNGLWQYAITDKDAKQPSSFDGEILVPFPVESTLSGVKKPVLPTQQLWYKRSFDRPATKEGERILLHFGAVDWQTKVYVNGKEAGQHAGGYQNFSFDITSLLVNGRNELVVDVYDPTDQGPNPHGKQVLAPKGIRYTATTGIWQTVWLETVPAIAITDLMITPEVDEDHLSLTVHTSGETDYTIEAIASTNGKMAGSVKGPANQPLKLPLRNAHLWSPEDPFLYDLSVRLVKNGAVKDKVKSYFGMRKIEVKKDDQGQERIFLNNKYTYNLGVLDQGFWPDGIYTAPTDEALRFDIAAIKGMGFNTIRKHIKIEPARWYYHADKLGMLVWQDMVTCASLEPDAKAAFEVENEANVNQLYNHPSIICWVLFNEGWYTYDQPRLTQWLQQRDHTRLINGHTGENYGKDGPQDLAGKWANSDLADIHDYPGPGIAPALPGKARVLGEWGGVGVPVKGHQWNAAAGWGYVKITPSEMIDKYASMVKRLKTYETAGQSGSIYTEPFDVEIEENGLITYDREVVKVPLETLRRLHAPFTAQERSKMLLPTLALKNADTTSIPDPHRRQFLALLEMDADVKKTGNYKILTDTLTDYLRNGGTSFSPAKISSISKKVFEGTNDTTLLHQALKWMEKAVDMERNSFTMSTYANLLYKLGNKEEALKWMDKAVVLAPESEQPDYQVVMDKMQKGENTWP
ncbi:sugar-binding domain-containing protein [Chitinophaga filiformis]|uniref:Glycosyl hydrolases family 2, TIM barrel domain n=1 Tax=Chitinophaga filiformis TaxID=104663 RepID=A0A1G7S1B8_CHIFI|nr:sugar-binding domain-containing protein [Chitinophaga filiformis]SDG16808.1 Glycosyl hydrolases family 2, TIM barrel domain [Chitinophaga filiformis]